MIAHIDFKGRWVEACSLPGEQRADGVYPGHPNGTQLSRNRWLAIYCTRGLRTVDDDRSVVYQIRADAPVGPVLREGMLRVSINDWDPRGDGSRYVRQLGHPVVFGVPKGARIEGRVAPAANVFVAKWRIVARGVFDPATGLVDAPPPEIVTLTQGVEWLQFRLNDREDDIEILQPPVPLRQRGFADGPRYCSATDAGSMNQSFSQAIPFNAWATEWVDCNHFGWADAAGKGRARVAPLKYRFDPGRGVYEWVETGPYIASEAMGLGEASIARLDTGWLIAARGENAIGWVHTEDPFRHMPSPVLTTSPAINAPVTLYTCADGVPRIFTGDCATSPYGTGRNPLYCWDVAPQTCQPANPRLIFDCIRSGTLPGATIPRAEMCKLLPHGGGPTQFLVWRVRTKNILRPYGSLPPITAADAQACGLYCAAVTYDRDCRAAWQFDN